MEKPEAVVRLKLVGNVEAIGYFLDQIGFGNIPGGVIVAEMSDIEEYPEEEFVADFQEEIAEDELEDEDWDEIDHITGGLYSSEDGFDPGDFGEYGELSDN